MRSRREFLKQSAIVSLTPSLPAFLSRSVQSAHSQQDKILVVVQLSGGNDGLNTVVPYRDEHYHSQRKELKLSVDSLIKLDDSTALHPSMRGFANLYQQGSLAIVQGVGYPDPNRSHDVSMAIWHTARTAQELLRDTGWLGRCFDHQSTRPRVPSAIVTAADETPRAIRGRKSQIASIDSLDEFRSLPASNLYFSNLDESAEHGTSQRSTQSSLGEFMRQTAVESQWTIEQIRSISSSDANKRRNHLDRFANPFAKQLSVIAELIRAEFGSTVYYAAQTGYDTHSFQLDQHRLLLETLSSSLEAFMKDIEASGHADRVLVMAFSEFGRQVEENASLGTDHGTSGPMFLIGKKVRAGILGQPPDLSKLIDNAPFHSIDFRDVYAGILKGWLKADPATILDGHSTAMEVVSG